MAIGHFICWELNSMYWSIKDCQSLLLEWVFFSLLCGSRIKIMVFIPDFCTISSFQMLFFLRLSGFFQLKEHLGWPVVLAGANTAVVVDWAESILSIKIERVQEGGGNRISRCIQLLQTSTALCWNAWYLVPVKLSQYIGIILSFTD